MTARLFKKIIASSDTSSAKEGWKKCVACGKSFYNRIGHAKRCADCKYRTTLTPEFVSRKKTMDNRGKVQFDGVRDQKTIIADIDALDDGDEEYEKKSHDLWAELRKARMIL